MSIIFKRKSVRKFTGEEVSDELIVSVDMSGYVEPEEIAALEAKASEVYQVVGEALKGIYPVMDDAALSTLENTIADITYQAGDDFTSQYDRYMEAGSGKWLQPHFCDTLPLDQSILFTFNNTFDKPNSLY